MYFFYNIRRMDAEGFQFDRTVIATSRHVITICDADDSAPQILCLLLRGIRGGRDVEDPGQVEPGGEHAESGTPGGCRERLHNGSAGRQRSPVALDLVESLGADGDEERLVGDGG